MPTFLDESGDPGTRATSAPFFRLAAVRFETAEQAETCRAAIMHLRKDVLRLEQGFEFKSAKTPVKYVRAFLEAVAAHPFRFVVSSLDKKAMPSGLRDKEDVHRLVAGSVATALEPVYRDAEANRGVTLGERVVADRTDDAVYFRVLREVFLGLRSPAKSGASLVKSVKPGNSHADDLLQLTDIVCGVVGWHLGGESSFYKMIEGKKLDVIILPGNAGRGQPKPPASE